MKRECAIPAPVFLSVRQIPVFDNSLIQAMNGL